MSNRSKATLIQARLGILRSALIAVKGILLIPLYIKMIGPEMYGFWLASGGVLAWLTMLDLGLVRGLNQRMASEFGKKRPEEAVKFLINGFIIYFGMTIIVGLVGIGFSFFVPRLFDVEADQVSLLINCFRLAVLASMFRILSGVFRVFCLSALRPTWPLLSMNLTILGGIGATVVSLYMGLGLWALPIGMLFTDFVYFLLVGFYAISIGKKFPQGFIVNRHIIKDLWRLTPSLFGSRIGSALVRNIEPTIITILVSPTVATAFVVTRRVAEVIAQTIQIGAGSTSSGFAHLLGEGNRSRAVLIANRLLLMYFVFSSIGYGLFIIGSDVFIRLWAGDEVFVGTGIAVLMVFSLFLRGLMELLATLLTASGDVARASWGTLIEAGIRLALMSAFVVIFGVVGAPVGMIFTCFLALIFFNIRLRVALQVKRLLLKIRPVIWTVGVTIIISILFVFLFPDHNSWLLLFTEIILASLCILGLNVIFPQIREVFSLVLGKSVSKPS